MELEEGTWAAASSSWPRLWLRKHHHPVGHDVEAAAAWPWSSDHCQYTTATPASGGTGVASVAVQPVTKTEIQQEGAEEKEQQPQARPTLAEQRGQRRPLGFQRSMANAQDARVKSTWRRRQISARRTRSPPSQRRTWPGMAEATAEATVVASPDAASRVSPERWRGAK
jgi:hypothetical protein